MGAPFAIFGKLSPASNQSSEPAFLPVGGHRPRTQNYQGEVQLMTLHSDDHSRIISGLVGKLQNHLVANGAVMAGRDSQPQPNRRRIHAPRSVLSSWNPVSEEVPFPLAQAAS